MSILTETIKCDVLHSMTKIQEAVERLVKKHGSYRKAGDAIGINYAYLQRLATAERIDPSDAVLTVLGLERRITYVWRMSANGQAKA